MKFARAVVSACILTFLAVFAGESTPAHANNGWDVLRWPWAYNQSWQLTQQWNGATSHYGTVFYAVDASVGQGYHPLYSEAEGNATCDWRNTFGYTTRVTYGSLSVTNSHMFSCWFGSTPSFVTQGYRIGDQGDSDASGRYHVHIQVNYPASSMSSQSFSISGYTPTNNGGSDCPCPYKTSDNLGSGYDTSFNFYSTMHDKFVSSGGYSVVGSTVALPYYQSPCLLSSPAVAGCSTNGYSGIVQTFRGAGSAYGGSEHGIFQRSGGNAVFMSRALYYPYTLYWDGSGHQGMYFIGYPLADSYYWYGVYRMDFQNGYATFNPSGCQSLWYQGGTLIKSYSGYCD